MSDSHKIVKQFEVWDVVDGKPKKLQVKQAIGLSKVNIDKYGWLDRSSFFDNESECLEFLANHKPGPIDVFVKGIDS